MIDEARIIERQIYMKRFFPFPFNAAYLFLGFVFPLHPIALFFVTKIDLYCTILTIISICC
jgi:hypothetical protein